MALLNLQNTIRLKHLRNLANMSLKIQFMSDLHLEFYNTRVKLCEDVDLVVLAGDIAEGHKYNRAPDWVADNLGTEVPVVMVLGNHDYWRTTFKEAHENIREYAEKVAPNMRILEDSCIQVNGYTICGSTLWTDYSLCGTQDLAMFDARRSMNDFEYMRLETRHAVTPDTLLNKHHRSVAYIKECMRNTEKGKLVVVTHHAPHQSSLMYPDNYTLDLSNSSYATDLSELLTDEAHCPALWIHGHTHWAVDYILVEGTTRVVSNPLGYVVKGDQVAYTGWSPEWVVALNP